jgi:hypothetical protein
VFRRDLLRIFHGQIRSADSLFTFADLTAADFRHAVDEFVRRSDVQRRGLDGFVQRDGELVTGVMVNCLGDSHIHRWPAYQPFRFHHKQWFSEGHVAPVAIGLPVRMYRIEQSICANGRTLVKSPHTSSRSKSTSWDRN